MNINTFPISLTKQTVLLFDEKMCRGFVVEGDERWWMVMIVVKKKMVVVMIMIVLVLANRVRVCA
eukprot:m.68709 g.68709  ORF g.68709 m.68709 type:complete len:65 (+) comp23984_c0_seq2:93-287(+)